MDFMLIASHPASWNQIIPWSRLVCTLIVIYVLLSLIESCVCKAKGVEAGLLIYAYSFNLIRRIRKREAESGGQHRTVMKLKTLHLIISIWHASIVNIFLVFLYVPQSISLSREIRETDPTSLPISLCLSQLKWMFNSTRAMVLYSKNIYNI